MSKFDELTDKIFAWGKARKIHENGNTVTQLVKAREEYEETKDAAINKDLDELRDGIGDTYVCLVQACGCAGVLITNGTPDGYGRERSRQSCDWESVKILTYELDPMLRGFQDFLDLANEEGREVTAQEILSESVQLVFQLGVIALEAGFTFEECLEQAYNEIKDRTGHLNEDGVFVKDE
jgi:hypothetical protein